jgi:hypothetical protein
MQVCQSVITSNLQLCTNLGHDSVASVQNGIQLEINPFGGRCVISVIETTGARNFSIGNLSTRIIRVP